MHGAGILFAKFTNGCIWGGGLEIGGIEESYKTSSSHTYYCSLGCIHTKPGTVTKTSSLCGVWLCFLLRFYCCRFAATAWCRLQQSKNQASLEQTLLRANLVAGCVRKLHSRTARGLTPALLVQKALTNSLRSFEKFFGSVKLQEVRVMDGELHEMSVKSDKHDQSGTEHIASNNKG